MSQGVGRPEFSRLFRIERLGAAPVVETLAANPAERAALAERLDLVALDDLSAVLTIRREPGIDLVRVEGRLTADVVQICVVSLEPFPSHVEDEVSASFSHTIADVQDEAGFDPEEDPVEPIIDNVIDLGEIVAQFLSLALDPHPRAPGVVLEPVWTGDDVVESPFAALRKFKSGQ